MQCPNCKKYSSFSKKPHPCRYCGYEMTVENSSSQAIDEPKTPIGTSQIIYVPSKGTAAINTLRFLAWFALVAGIIGAILIWIEFEESISLGIGIGILLQGIFTCAFFLVIALIAENVIEIRKNIVSINKENITHNT
jgi:hypothetical protein